MMNPLAPVYTHTMISQTHSDMQSVYVVDVLVNMFFDNPDRVVVVIGHDGPDTTAHKTIVAGPNTYAYGEGMGAGIYYRELMKFIEAETAPKPERSLGEYRETLLAKNTIDMGVAAGNLDFYAKRQEQLMGEYQDLVTQREAIRRATSVDELDGIIEGEN